MLCVWSRGFMPVTILQAGISTLRRVQTWVRGKARRALAAGNRLGDALRGRLGRRSEHGAGPHGSPYGHEARAPGRVAFSQLLLARSGIARRLWCSSFACSLWSGVGGGLVREGCPWARCPAGRVVRGAGALDRVPPPKPADLDHALPVPMPAGLAADAARPPRNGRLAPASPRPRGQKPAGL